MSRTRAATITLGIAAVTAFALGSLEGCGGGRMSSPDGPSYILRGTATGQDERPLPFASIALEGTSLGALTDSLGRFGIDPVRAGDYALVVLHLGYRSAPVLLRAREPLEATATVPFLRDRRLGPALADSAGSVRIAYRLERSR